VIHGWRASSDAPARQLGSLLRVLSDAERSRAAQLCSERDRRWFTAGHAVSAALAHEQQQQDLAPASGSVAALADEGGQVLPTTCVWWPEW
jgi:hypothetical protein